MFEVFSGVLAAILVASIAFPEVFYTMKRETKKLVGSTYWGMYKDVPTENSEDRKIVMPKPGRKSVVVAGSQMYAGGNGRK